MSMMEILTLIAPAVFSALLAPVAVKWFTKLIDSRKEKRTEESEEEKYNDTLASSLRKELRDENLALKERNTVLESQVRASIESILEGDTWKRKFYAVKKEKQHLEFEITLLRQELEYLRSQYDEYIALRKRAEERISDDGDDTEPV